MHEEVVAICEDDEFRLRFLGKVLKDCKVSHIDKWLGTELFPNDAEINQEEVSQIKKIIVPKDNEDMSDESSDRIKTRSRKIKDPTVDRDMWKRKKLEEDHI